MFRFVGSALKALRDAEEHRKHRRAIQEIQPGQAFVRARGSRALETVQVAGIVESDADVASRYEPDHPFANEEGYVFSSNVNPVEEMVNMLSASRSYQNNIEVLNTTKEMLIRTISLGQ